MKWMKALAILSLPLVLVSCQNKEEELSYRYEEGVSSLNDFTFNYFENKGGYVVEDYHGSDSNVFVPSEVTLNGLTAPVVGIGSYAFSKRKIQAVYLSNSIRSLGDYAFADSDATAIYVTPYLFQISSDAFTNSKIRFSKKDGVSYLPTKLGRYGYAIAYQGHEGDKVTLAEECEAIYDEIFGNNIEVTVSKNTIAFGDISLNSHYRPYDENVKSISPIKVGYHAFGNWANLEEVYLQDEVTWVDGFAFSFCTNLKSIHFGKGFVGMNDDAFGWCASLEEIEIPSTTKNIGFGVFHGCVNLKSLQIPANVESIGNSIVSGCAALQSLRVDPANPNYDSRDDSNLIIETKTNTIIAGCSKSIIPDSATKIAAYAFNDCGLEHLFISKNIQEIGLSAFEDNPFVSIEVEEGNPIYDSRDNCNALIRTASNELLYGSGSAFIPFSVTSIRDHAFASNPHLTSIDIPASVKSIGYAAFEECANLASVSLREGLESIGNFAFSDCSALRKIIIPASVTIMGWYVFSCDFSLHIYCRAKEKGANWDEEWNNYGGYDVTWGYSGY